MIRRCLMIQTADAIREQIGKLAALRHTEIEWMVNEAMACKPLEDRANIRSDKIRDDANHVEYVIWNYLGVPFLQCKTYMTPGGQLRFELERIDDAPKIITQ